MCFLYILAISASDSIPFSLSGAFAISPAILIILGANLFAYITACSSPFAPAWTFPFKLPIIITCPPAFISAPGFTSPIIQSFQYAQFLSSYIFSIKE